MKYSNTFKETFKIYFPSEFYEYGLTHMSVSNETEYETYRLWFNDASRLTPKLMQKILNDDRVYMQLTELIKESKTGALIQFPFNDNVIHLIKTENEFMLYLCGFSDCLVYD